MVKYIFIILLFIFSFETISYSQSDINVAENKLSSQAFKLLKEDKFDEALPLFSQLLSLYPQNADYNFGYGVCLVECNRDIPKAIKYLEYAQKHNDQTIINYYLGLANHLNYNFTDAIIYYQTFKSQAKKSELQKYQVDNKITQCRNGQALIRYISDLVVVDNKKIRSENYFYSYDLSDFGGRLIMKPAELKSRWDLRHEDKNTVVFLSQKKGEIYFASYDKSLNRDIYKVSLNKDGTFGTPENLGSVINTEFEEDFPVLHSDGITLYFSSKGHNSMGGFDIFRSVFDTINLVWSKPENLDFPINTPYDDFLYVSDADEIYAYFASNRETTEDRISVYKIIVDKNPIKREFNNLEEIQQKSLLEISSVAEIRKAEEAKKKDSEKAKEIISSVSSPSSIKSSFQPLSYSASLTQSIIAKEAESDIEELYNQTSTLNNQSQLAYNIAQQRNIEAEKKRQEAAQISLSLPKINNSEQRILKEEEALLLIEEAEKLEKEAILSYNLAKNLENNVSELNKEIVKAENFAKAIKSATSTASVESLVESINQNREKLNQSQNKLTNIQEQAVVRKQEMKTKEQEYAKLLTEKESIEKIQEEKFNKLKSLEKQYNNAPDNEKAKISNQILDISNEINDLKQNYTAINESFDKAKADYAEIRQEAVFYDNFINSKEILSDEIALNIDKKQLEQELFEKELAKDIKKADPQLYEETTSYLTESSIRTEHKEETKTEIEKEDESLLLTEKYLIQETTKPISSSINQLIDEKKQELAAATTAAQKEEIVKEINDLITLAEIQQEKESKAIAEQQEAEKEKTFAESFIFPSVPKEKQQDLESNYKNELLNAAFYESLAKEQENQLSVLKSIAENNPNNKNLKSQIIELENSIEENKGKSQKSKNIASLMAEDLPNSVTELFNTPEQLLSDIYDYESTININFSTKQSEQNVLISNLENNLSEINRSFSNKQNYYLDLKKRRETTSNKNELSKLTNDINKAEQELREEITNYKKVLNDLSFERYNQDKSMIISQKNYLTQTGIEAAIIEKEADLLYEKAEIIRNNINLFNDVESQYAELEKSKSLDNLSSQKQRYALELYVKSAAIAEESPEKIIAPTVAANTTTLNADEERDLKEARKESYKAEAIINQAVIKLEDVNSRKLRAENAFSTSERNNILKGVDKEEETAKNNLYSGLTLQNKSDSLKYVAYNSHIKTLINQPNINPEKIAIANEFISEANRLSNESQRIKNEARNAKNIDSQIELSKKAVELNQKAITLQGIAVETIAEPNPALFVSTSSLTQLERLEVIDSPISTDDVVRIKTERIISRVNPNESDLKTLDDANKKIELASNLRAEADAIQNEIDEHKSVLNNPNANPKERKKAQKQIKSLDKNLMVRIFTSEELIEQANDAKFNFNKNYLAENRLNNNTKEDRQSKQLERSAIRNYNKAKSLRDRSFMTDDPQKAFDLLLQARKLEELAMQEQEQAFGINLSLPPVEEEIAMYNEQRTAKVQSEFDINLKTTIEPTTTATYIAETSTKTTTPTEPTKKRLDDYIIRDTEASTKTSSAENVPTYDDQDDLIVVVYTETEDIIDEEEDLTLLFITDLSDEEIKSTAQLGQDDLTKKSTDDKGVKKDLFIAENIEDEQTYEERQTTINIEDDLLLSDYSIEKEDKTADDLYIRYDEIEDDEEIIIIREDEHGTRIITSDNIDDEKYEDKRDSEVIIEDDLYVRYDDIDDYSDEIIVIREDEQGTRIITEKPVEEEKVSRIIREKPIEKETKTESTRIETERTERATRPEQSSSQLFSLLPYDVYSKDNPIPVNPEIPSGIVFKVQIGAFKNKIDENSFKGLNPVTAEILPNSQFIRYLVGLFQTIDGAIVARDEVRKIGYNDAFVVAYRNGKRISVYEARRFIEQGESISDYNLVAQNETNLIKNRIARPDAATTTTTPTPSSTSEIQATSTPATSVTPTTSSYTDITTMQDLLYTVQIGVYKNPVSRAELKNLNPIFEERTYGGFIRYTTGIFNNVQDAVREKDRIVQVGIPDAFVSAYYKGQKVTLNEANRILSSGQAVSKVKTETPVSYPEQTIEVKKPSSSIDKSSIVFKVQVGAYKEQVPVDMVNRFIVVASNHGLNQNTIEGVTIYSVGNFNNYDEAQRIKNIIVNEGLRDAFVVAFAGNKKITVPEALEILNNN